MAEIILHPANDTSTKTIFEAPANIRIDSIHNKYSLALNFEEGEVVNAGQEIYIDQEISVDSFEIINGVRQLDGFVTVQYTEI